MGIGTHLYTGINYFYIKTCNLIALFLRSTFKLPASNVLASD